MIFYCGLMVHITDTRTQKVVSYTSAHITETVLAHDQHWEEHKIIRLITFSSYRSNAEKLYAQLKILNLNDIYKLQIAKLMHKFEHDCLPSVFNYLFTKLDNIHSYNTRQKTSQEYIVPSKRLAIAQKSLAYIGVKIWESLDQNLKVQPFYIFEKKCKLHLNQY